MAGVDRSDTAPLIASTVIGQSILSPAFRLPVHVLSAYKPRVRHTKMMKIILMALLFIHTASSFVEPLDLHNTNWELMTYFLPVACSYVCNDGICVKTILRLGKSPMRLRKNITAHFSEVDKA